MAPTNQESVEKISECDNVVLAYDDDANDVEEDAKDGHQELKPGVQGSPDPWCCWWVTPCF